jgi:hypothetical protein
MFPELHCWFATNKSLAGHMQPPNATLYSLFSPSPPFNKLGQTGFRSMLYNNSLYQNYLISAGIYRKGIKTIIVITISRVGKQLKLEAYIHAASSSGLAVSIVTCCGVNIRTKETEGTGKFN